MNAPEQVVDRTQFIGSSDMAAILGLSPWQTPLELWEQKLGIAPPADADPEKARLFRRGKRMEPVIVSMLIEERGLQVIARNKRYTDTEYPFFSVEIDAEAMISGERTNVECKSAHPFTAWKYGSEGTDQVPMEYLCQAMFSLMVTKRRRCLFGVLFGTDNLVTYSLERDEETIAEMRERAAHFWREHVLKEVPPAPINLPDVERMLRKIDPTTVTASPEVELLVVELEMYKDQERIAREGIEDKKFEIGKAILGAAALRRPIGPRGGKGSIEPTAEASPLPHVVLVAGQPRLQISLLSRSGIDSDMVRTLHPLVAAECTVASPYLKFGKPPKPKTARRQKRS